MKQIIISSMLLLYSFFAIADQYRVELGVFETVVELSYFENKGIEEVNLLVDNNNLYRYYVGDFKDRATAEAIQKKATAKGMTYAKVINFTEAATACANSCTYPGKIENIFFDFNQYTLRGKSKEELEKLGNYLQRNTSNMVRLNGHTDARGDEYYNVGLSKNRTRIAKQYLMKQGIAQYRILEKEFGETTPIAKNNYLGNDSPEGRQYNRRVVFEILDRDGNEIKGIIKPISIPELLRAAPFNNTEALLSMVL